MFLNILLRILHRKNLTITGRGFSPAFLNWQILWLFSMSWGALSVSKFWLIVSTIISSIPLPLISLIPCRKFLFDSCSGCWTCCSSFETLFNEILTLDWRLPIIFFYFYFFDSSNLAEIYSAESCKSFSYLSPLICCSWADIAKTIISFICFSTFCKKNFYTCRKF